MRPIAARMIEAWREHSLLRAHVGLVSVAPARAGLSFAAAAVGAALAVSGFLAHPLLSGTTLLQGAAAAGTARGNRGHGPAISKERLAVLARLI